MPRTVPKLNVGGVEQRVDGDGQARQEGRFRLRSTGKGAVLEIGSVAEGQHRDLGGTGVDDPVLGDPGTGVVAPLNSHRVVARRRWYGAFLTKVATVSYREGSLQLWDTAQQPIASISATDIVGMRLDQHWISADLVVTTGDGTVRCRTLPLTRGRELIKAFHDDLDRVAAARPRARELTAKIEMIDQRRSALLSDSAYARYSEAEGLHNDAKGLVAQCDWYVRQCMSDTTNEALQRIEEIVVREEMVVVEL